MQSGVQLWREFLARRMQGKSLPAVGVQPPPAIAISPRGLATYTHNLVANVTSPGRQLVWGNNSRRIAFIVGFETAAILHLFSGPGATYANAYFTFQGGTSHNFPFYDYGPLVTGELHIGISFGGAQILATEIVSLP